VIRHRPSLVVGHEIHLHQVSNGGSYKCDGIPMDSLITAAARRLRRVILAAH
jgi:hypothetical protein